MNKKKSSSSKVKNMFLIHWFDILEIVLMERRKSSKEQGTVSIILIVLIIGKASTVRF